MEGSPGRLVPRRLCCHGEPLGTLGTLVWGVPTASLVGMCAQRGNSLPKQILKKKKDEFREVKGLGCGHRASSVALQD